MIRTSVKSFDLNKNATLTKAIASSKLLLAAVKAKVVSGFLIIGAMDLPSKKLTRNITTK